MTVEEDVRQRAVEIALHERTCREESRHCAAGMAQGLAVAMTAAPFRTLDGYDGPGPYKAIGVSRIERRADPESRRALVISILAGHYGADGKWDADWDLRHPPFTNPPHEGDERALLELVKGYSEPGWRALISDVRIITSMPRFKVLAETIERALLEHEVLDETDLLDVEEACELAPYERIRVKAHHDVQRVLTGASASDQDERARQYAIEHRQPVFASFPC